MPLSAGDWDISSLVSWGTSDHSNTMEDVQVWISDSSMGTTLASGAATARHTGSGVARVTTNISAFRYSQNAASTIYQMCNSPAFTTVAPATAGYSYYLYARRMR
jgi:hypothetical protein